MWPQMGVTDLQNFCSKKSMIKAKIRMGSVQ